MFHLNTTIKTGSHKLPSEGSCAMEIATLASGHDWRRVESADDLPDCMCRVIGAYVIRLNDAMPDAPRQELMQFIPRLAVTAGSAEVQQQRAKYLVMNAAKPAAVFALRKAGYLAHADKVEAANNLADLRSAAADAARDAAWAAAWAARAAADAVWAARAAAWAAAMAAAEGAAGVSRFDWSPYLSALDGALKIGPQAPDLEVENIIEMKRILEIA